MWLIILGLLCDNSLVVFLENVLVLRRCLTKYLNVLGVCSVLTNDSTKSEERSRSVSLKGGIRYAKYPLHDCLSKQRSPGRDALTEDLFGDRFMGRSRRREAKGSVE